MKFFLVIFLLFISLNGYAYNHSYSVSGTDDNGGAVSGTAYANTGDDDVSGDIVDEKGDKHLFYGQWDGDGHISGETEDGEYLELDTE